MIKIINGLDITQDGVAIFNHKWQHVHFRQGDIDGACAVYSLMMNLLILKVLKRSQVIDLGVRFKGNTAKGRLYKEFFETEGLCRDGFYFTEIRDKLSRSFAKEVQSYAQQYDHVRKEQAKFLSDVKNAIDQDAPLMVSISFMNGAHAMLAIGYEERDAEVTKVFCLDPGCNINRTTYWNAVILINSSLGRRYSHSYMMGTECTSVYVSESLKVIKK